MPTLRLYNTLGRKLEEFKPIEPGKVGFYGCGPTVYNYAHIGNLRAYVFDDTLVRTLRYLGYEVKHVMYDVLLLQLEKGRIPLKNGASYTFDIGPKELIGLIGLAAGEGNLIIHKLLENPKIRLAENKLMVTDIGEIVNQTEYYRKMQKIERARREGASAAR